MKICPECKTTNIVDEDNYCYRDGMFLVEMAQCECGRQLLPRIDVFCSRCGKPVETEAAKP